MGDLAIDTEVTPAGPREEGVPARFRATLRRDWEIWGPNGGYLAAVILRAAGAYSALPRPATLTCHFHGVAAFDEVDLEVVPLRTGRSAASLRVVMTQDGRSVAEAMAWTVADDLPVLEHDAAPPPDVPPPGRLPDIPLDAYPFWANFDRRPLEFRTAEEWFGREPSEPVDTGWYRYTPTPVFEDPWVEAARSTVLLDTLNWPAAARAHRERDLEVVAPSLDVSIQYHRPPLASAWLLCQASAPVAADGLVGSHARVWAEDGRLLASARQQMLCRQLPGTAG